MLLLLARMHRVRTIGISSTIGKVSVNSETKSADRWRLETTAGSWPLETHRMCHGCVSRALAAHRKRAGQIHTADTAVARW